MVDLANNIVFSSEAEAIQYARDNGIALTIPTGVDTPDGEVYQTNIERRGTSAVIVRPDIKDDTPAPDFAAIAASVAALSKTIKSLANSTRDADDSLSARISTLEKSVESLTDAINVINKVIASK